MAMKKHRHGFVNNGVDQYSGLSLRIGILLIKWRVHVLTGKFCYG